MTFHVQGLLPRRCIVIFCISQISCELPILCLPVVTHFDRFHRSFISQFGSSITIYLYIIYMVSCSVFLPPPLYGSPGSTPFPSICKLLAAFLRSSLVFARSLQHFWLPASHLLGTCYLLDDLRSTHTPSKYLRATYSHIYMCYVPTFIHTCMHACIHTYIRAYVHTYIHTCIHTCSELSLRILMWNASYVQKHSPTNWSTRW